MDKNLFLGPISITGQVKPNFKFYLAGIASRLDHHHQTGRNPTLNYSKSKNELPKSILVTKHTEITSNYLGGMEPAS